MRPRDKGTRAESAVAEWLGGAGFTGVTRAPLWGEHDRGDIVGVPFVVSVKDHKEARLAEWVDRLGVMVVNSGHQWGVVIHKRQRKGNPSDWYVTTSGGLWLRMVDGHLNR